MKERISGTLGWGFSGNAEGILGEGSGQTGQELKNQGQMVQGP